MKKKISKKTIILIIMIILILLFLILIVYRFSSHPKENHDPDKVVILPGVPADSDRIIVTNSRMKKERCVGDICIKNLTVTCYPDRGSITYKITNKDTKKRTGHLKVVFENYTGYVVFEDLEPKKTIDGYIGYSGFDLRNVKDYQLKELTVNDYSAFVN